MKLINCLFQFPGSGQTKSWSGRTNWSWEMLSSLHWAGIPRWDAADQRPRDSENKLGQHCSVSEGHGYKRPPVLRLYGCSSNADPDICHGTAPCTQCSGRWRSPNKAGKKGRLQKIFLIVEFIEKVDFLKNSLKWMIINLLFWLLLQSSNGYTIFQKMEKIYTTLNGKYGYRYSTFIFKGHGNIDSLSLQGEII